jgi:hypothetical protein
MESDIAAIARGQLNPEAFMSSSIVKLKRILSVLTDFPRLLDEAMANVGVVDMTARENTAVRRAIGRGRRRGRGGNRVQRRNQVRR